MSNDKNKSSGESVTKTRNYATVVYPESAPDNWKSIISESKVPIFVSPLHDQDFNPNGEHKKPHHHVIFMYDGPKTLKQAKEFAMSFGGVGCEAVKSLRAYARYLCHMDNPEKAQYCLDDVDSFGGADYINVIGTAADKTKNIREMQTWIAENDIVSFADLCDYAMVNRSDWFDVLINSGSYYIKEYIKSRTWALHKELEK